jgi:hypothetical protein
MRQLSGKQCAMPAPGCYAVSGTHAHVRCGSHWQTWRPFCATPCPPYVAAARGPRHLPLLDLRATSSSGDGKKSATTRRVPISSIASSASRPEGRGFFAAAFQSLLISPRCRIARNSAAVPHGAPGFPAHDRSPRSLMRGLDPRIRDESPRNKPYHCNRG